MINKSKKYKILILVIIGLVFLGIGCAGKNSEGSSIAQNNSSGGTPVKEATAVKSQSISVKGSDTVLPLAQAEAEEFINESVGKSMKDV